MRESRFMHLAIGTLLILQACASTETSFERVWESVQVGDAVTPIEQQLTHEYMLSQNMLVWRSQVVGGTGMLQYFATQIFETQDPNDMIPKPDTLMYQIDFDKNLLVTDKRVDSYKNLQSENRPCEE